MLRMFPDVIYETSAEWYWSKSHLNNHGSSLYPKGRVISVPFSVASVVGNPSTCYYFVFNHHECNGANILYPSIRFKLVLSKFLPSTCSSEHCIAFMRFLSLISCLPVFSFVYGWVGVYMVCCDITSEYVCICACFFMYACVCLYMRMFFSCVCLFVHVQAFSCMCVFVWLLNFSIWIKHWWQNCG